MITATVRYDVKKVAISATNFHFIFIFLDVEQSLAMQHFVEIYQDSLKVFSIEELRYVIYYCLEDVNRLHESALFTMFKSL